MSHKLVLFLMILLFTQITAPQIVDEKIKPEDSEKLEKEAVEFLRESLAEVNNMRTLENRISFSAELASLMWFHDEREARGMFVGVIGDFRQLLMQYDTQTNALVSKPEDDTDGAGFGFMGDRSSQSRLERKFRTAMAVRQQIAMSIAEHDPELAFSFFHDSLSAVSNPALRKQTEGTDSYFEFQLITQIASTDPAKAEQFGKKSLGKGLNYQHVELLKKLYSKDPDKAADFAGDILSSIKGQKTKTEDFWVFSSLLNFGTETLEKSKLEGGKKPVFTDSEMRDLADIFAQAILDQPANDAMNGTQFADQIEKYAPGRAAQIRAKFRKSGTNMSRVYGANRAAYATNAARMANVSIDDDYDPSVNVRDDANVQIRKKQDEKEKAEKELVGNMQKLGTKQLPKDEREKIVAEARKILLLTPGRDKKIAGLSLLAAQVAKAGDKELAGEIMKDAESLVNPQPKTYQDFLLTWMLVSGYAAADPDKAFPLLEDTIGRANDTIAAFVKVGEFIDTDEEMIQDGEVQVGAFGGSMIRGLTGELGMADMTIQLLAKADFNKTKNLTNRFDRAEVRVLAKMMVLRAVLGNKNKARPDAETEITSAPVGIR